MVQVDRRIWGRREERAEVVIYYLHVTRGPSRVTNGDPAAELLGQLKTHINGALGSQDGPQRGYSAGLCLRSICKGPQNRNHRQVLLILLLYSNQIQFCLLINRWPP